MQTLYTIVLVISIVVAVLFALLVFFTGKGDAMSGGSSVRTSFKGKASFEDIMSRFTLYLGIAFMVLMLGLDVMSNQIHGTPGTPRLSPSATTGGGDGSGTTGSDATTTGGTTTGGTTGSEPTTTTGGTTGTTPTTGGTTGSTPTTTGTGGTTGTGTTG